MTSSSSNELSRYERYLAADPTNLELLARCADLLIEQGRAGDALPYVERALAQDGHSPHFLYRKGVILRRLARDAEAIEALDTLYRNGERNPLPLYELAMAQFHVRDFAACAATLQDLIQHPGYRALTPNADFLLVRALHHLGQLSDAIAHAEAALQARPESAELRGALATLYLDDEQTDKAAALLKDAATHGPLNAEMECVAGFIALGGEDLEAAQRDFAVALADSPGDGRALLGSGLVAAAQRDLPGAIEQIKRAAQAMPDHLGTWNALAWMQLVSGDLVGAEQSFRSADAIDHNFGETHGGLAVIAAMKGDTRQARTHLRTALRLNPHGFAAAYAGLLLQAGPNNAGEIGRGVAEFLSKQAAPGGGSLHDVVTRLAMKSGAPAHGNLPRS